MAVADHYSPKNGTGAFRCMPLKPLKGVLCYPATFSFIGLLISYHSRCFYLLYYSINKTLKHLFKLMKQVIVWADSAYEAISKIFPEWICLINQKGKRNHPLSDEQKLKNKLKTKIRILVEHVISRIKKYRYCLERTRNMTDIKQAQYWNIVSGICNLHRAYKLNIQHLFGYS